MSYNERPVFKYTVLGKLVDSFPNTTAAAKSVHMERTSFKEMIDSGGFLNGYIYSWSDEGIPPLPDIQNDLSAPQPWEKNGYFNINGWAKVCLY